MSGPLQALSRAMGGRPHRSMLVHRHSPSAPRTTALAPGIEALDAETFIQTIRLDKATKDRVRQ